MPSPSHGSGAPICAHPSRFCGNEHPLWLACLSCQSPFIEVFILGLDYHQFANDFPVHASSPPLSTLTFPAVD